MEQWGIFHPNPSQPISRFKNSPLGDAEYIYSCSTQAMGQFWSHSFVKIYCDNLAVVQVVRTNKTKDLFLAACIIDIWLISATLDITLDIQHIMGKRIEWLIFFPGCTPPPQSIIVYNKFRITAYETMYQYKHLIYI